MSPTLTGREAKPTRGKASARFRRRPTTGAAHQARVQWGETWGAYLSRAARQLRERK